VYLSGVACDPEHQGRGFATYIMTESIKILRLIPGVKYLTLRTMNHAVVKCCKRSCRQNTNDEQSVQVFPVDTFDERPDLIHVCNTIANIFGWKNVKPEKLMIECAYPDFLIPIFKGNVNHNQEDLIRNRVEEIINRDRGDALFCIVDL
jgi:hypothetical protein